MVCSSLTGPDANREGYDTATCPFPMGFRESPVQDHPAGLCFRGPLAYIQACRSESLLSSEWGPVQPRCPHRTEGFSLLNTHPALMSDREAHRPIPRAPAFPRGPGCFLPTSRLASAPRLWACGTCVPAPAFHSVTSSRQLPRSPSVSSALHSCRPSLPRALCLI